MTHLFVDKSVRYSELLFRALYLEWSNLEMNKMIIHPTNKNVSR